MGVLSTERQILTYFLARTKHHSHVVDEYDGYYPTVDAWTKPHRKRKPVITQRPVLPNNVIVPLPRLHACQIDPNVSGLVMYGKILLILTQQDVDIFREIQKRHIIQPIAEKPLHNYSPDVGHHVEVISGCFKSHSGHVVSHATLTTVIVEFPGFNAPVEIDHCLLAQVVANSDHRAGDPDAAT